MPGRLPTTKDFSAHLSLTITPPPAQDQPVNVLILFHGLGDTNASFANLGTRLALPETCCISLQAPTPLPFGLGGFQWGNDIAFDPSTGEMEFDTGFGKVINVIENDLIRDGLVKQCGYQPRDILMLGFGQGGMAALAVAALMMEELGGVVTIGGPAPASMTPRLEKSKTPITVLGGSSKTVITRNALETLERQFQTLEYHQWSKVGDGMPSCREEMLPIMRFFASRLQSRKGVPKGSVEIG